MCKTPVCVRRLHDVRFICAFLIEIKAGVQKKKGKKNTRLRKPKKIFKTKKSICVNSNSDISFITDSIPKFKLVIFG